MIPIEDDPESSGWSSTDDSLSGDESDEERCRQEKPPRYVIPQSVGKASLAGEGPPQNNSTRREKRQPVRRGNRNRRAAERFQAGNFEHDFYVNPEDIVKI